MAIQLCTENVLTQVCTCGSKKPQNIVDQKIAKRWNLWNNIPFLLLIGVADKPTDNKSGRIMVMVLDKPILIQRTEK